METNVDVLPLKPGIIYGPVNSRRLRRSLGINLSPVTKKLCTFNCIYCHFGWTERLTTDVQPYEDEFSSADEVFKAVHQALRIHKGLDYLTFSGNGEPTLHPEFEYIVEGVRAIRDELAPNTPLAILSNSSTLGSSAIQRAMARLDLRICKLDAGTQEMFQRMNKPAPGITLSNIQAALESFESLVLQAIFLGGAVDNTIEDNVSSWIESIARIKPQEVQIYSTDRPVPKKGIERIERATLAAIAKRAMEATGIPVQVFSLE